MEIVESAPFLEKSKDDMFYVGFLKTGEAWFPLCHVSNPEENQKFDTLLLSHTYPLMAETVEGYAKQVPCIEQTFVQYLMAQEIQNLVDRYALNQVLVLAPDETAEGCGCGCGCH
ncbi:hypothetical protein [Desulforhabdus sp. TSK]|uniref:hypothetical protein n=1 Tax=Desulforhabdus sp. TSK TaxID=2925014 RepID=UPI001FC83B1E|nr:hypothetical protein [Desulforhabdus sp. TSK]GKT10830.1 hypothetical protein DSTSK_41350 [Desulforhabdus sp. TSK]